MEPTSQATQIWVTFRFTKVTSVSGAVLVHNTAAFYMINVTKEKFLVSPKGS